MPDENVDREIFRASLKSSLKRGVGNSILGTRVDVLCGRADTIAT
jgi:hypothetical protein